MSDEPPKPSTGDRVPWHQFRFSWQRDWLLALLFGIGMLAMLPGICASLRNRPSVSQQTATTMNDLAERLGHVVRRDGKIPDDLSTMPTLSGKTSWLFDAWGRPITARLLPDGTVELLSLGRDAKPGGTGEDADVRGVFDPKGSPPEWWLVRPGQDLAATQSR